MKPARIFGFLATVCFLTTLPAGSVQKDESVLDQGFNLSQNLGGREHLSYLIDLCQMSDHLNLSAEKIREYSSTLYHLSSAVEQDVEWQVVGQKVAVSCLSNADPAAAMELLPKINFQRPGPGEWFYEDPRFNAAETTFINFLKSLEKITPRDVSNIIAKARYLGQTGQYPYLGVAEVLNRLPVSLKNEINTLLSDAIGFYATETGFYNRDREFLRLLQLLKNPAIDKELTVRAATILVQHLKNDPAQIPGDYYAEVVSNGKVFPFADRNESFLFQAFPEIKHFNPGLAAQLRQQDPKLDEASENVLIISGGFVQGDPTSGQATQEHLRLMQQYLLKKIKEREDCDPKAALELAQRLTDLSPRIVGFSAVIPGVAQTDSKLAHSLYEKQLSDLGNMDESIAKLQAMVALASAAYHLGDLNRHQSLSQDAFDMGVHFFNSARAAQVQNRKGFAELHELVSSAASQPLDTLSTKVRDLPDDWLKAYLLLYEAEGRAKRNSGISCPE